MLLEFHPLVEGELAESAEQYERKETGLGGRFLDEASELFRGLAVNPHLYAVRFADIRRVNFHSFPHGVFYFIAGEAVVVLAVMHGHRDFQRELDQRRGEYD